MSKIKKTVTVISVHRENEHPIFGEGVSRISLEDEGGGPFIEIQQPDVNDARLRFDLDELEEILVAARELINGVEILP